MTGKAMIAELVQCYVPPPSAVQEKMIRLADTIPEDARQDVIDRILESESSSTKISITHIVEACRAIGVGYKAAKYVPATDWTCEACGRQFKYHAAPTDDDKIDKGIFDACPDCGFQVTWSIMHSQYKALGMDPAWYARLASECLASFGPRVQPWTKHIGPKGAGLNLSRGGLYWSRHHAERERAEDRKEKVDAKIAEIDKAKRWDIVSEREAL